jgi:hypothetical protein
MAKSAVMFSFMFFQYKTELWEAVPFDAMFLYNEIVLNTPPT